MDLSTQQGRVRSGPQKGDNTFILLKILTFDKVDFVMILTYQSNINRPPPPPCQPKTHTLECVLVQGGFRD